MRRTALLVPAILSTILAILVLSVSSPAQQAVPVQQAIEVWPAAELTDLLERGQKMEGRAPVGRGGDLLRRRHAATPR